MSEEILTKITEAVEDAVDKKINGKLVGLKADNHDIKEHLKQQDILLEDVKKLLGERKFLMQLWGFLKYVGGILISIGGAILLYKQLK